MLPSNDVVLSAVHLSYGYHSDACSSLYPAGVWFQHCMIIYVRTQVNDAQLSVHTLEIDQMLRVSPSVVRPVNCVVFCANSTAFVHILSNRTVC